MNQLSEEIEAKIRDAERAIQADLWRTMFPPPTPEDLARWAEEARRRPPTPKLVKLRRWLDQKTWPARRWLAAWVLGVYTDEDDT